MLEGRCLPRACRRNRSFPRLRYGQARAPLGFGEGLPEHHLVACGRPSTLAGYPLPSGVRAADLWVGVLGMSVALRYPRSGPRVGQSSPSSAPARAPDPGRGSRPDAGWAKPPGPEHGGTDCGLRLRPRTPPTTPRSWGRLTGRVCAIGSARFSLQCARLSTISCRVTRGVISYRQ